MGDVKPTEQMKNVNLQKEETADKSFECNAVKWKKGIRKGFHLLLPKSRGRCVGRW